MHPICRLIHSPKARVWPLGMMPMPVLAKTSKTSFVELGAAETADSSMLTFAKLSQQPRTLRAQRLKKSNLSWNVRSEMLAVPYTTTFCLSYLLCRLWPLCYILFVYVSCFRSSCTCLARPPTYWSGRAHSRDRRVALWWNVQSPLKISILTFRIPHRKKGVWWLTRLKFSISLENVSIFGALVKLILGRFSCRIDHAQLVAIAPRQQSCLWFMLVASGFLLQGAATPSTPLAPTLMLGLHVWGLSKLGTTILSCCQVALGSQSHRHLLSMAGAPPLQEWRRLRRLSPPQRPNRDWVPPSWDRCSNAPVALCFAGHMANHRWYAPFSQPERPYRSKEALQGRGCRVLFGCFRGIAL